MFTNDFIRVTPILQFKRWQYSYFKIQLLEKCWKLCQHPSVLLLVVYWLVISYCYSSLCNLFYKTTIQLRTLTKLAMSLQQDEGLAAVKVVNRISFVLLKYSEKTQQTQNNTNLVVKPMLTTYYHFHCFDISWNVNNKICPPLIVSCVFEIDIFLCSFNFS